MRRDLCSPALVAASALFLSSIMPALAADMPALSPGAEAMNNRRSAVPATPALFKAAAQDRQAVPLAPPARNAAADDKGAAPVFVPGRRTGDVLTRSLTALPAVSGLPPRVVEACRLKIQAAAQGFGAVRVEASGAGPARRLGDGGYIAPALVRIVYPQSGGFQVRQAYTDCHFNNAGEVVATIAGRAGAGMLTTPGPRALTVASDRRPTPRGVSLERERSLIARAKFRGGLRSASLIKMEQLTPPASHALANLGSGASALRGRSAEERRPDSEARQS